MMKFAGILIMIVGIIELYAVLIYYNDISHMTVNMSLALLILTVVGCASIAVGVKELLD